MNKIEKYAIIIVYKENLVQTPSLEISSYKLPETIPEARNDLMARKVLQLFGVLQPFFDYNHDGDLQRTLEAHRERRLLVATDGRLSKEEALKGFLSYDVDLSYRSMTIHHLVVEELARGSGVGGALMSRAESIAEDDDLWSVNLRSTGDSVPFYAHRGYETVDEYESMMQLRLPRRR